MTQGVVAFVFTLLVGLVPLLRIELAAPGFRLSLHLAPALPASISTALVLPFLVVLDRRLDLLRDLRGGTGSVRA